jgi:type IV secretion system protein VirD4
MRLHPVAFSCRLLLLLAFSVAGLSAIALALHAPTVAVVPLGFVAYRRMRRHRGTADAFGSARPSNYADLVNHGLVGGDAGVLMGTAGNTEPPTKAEGFAALVNPAVNSDLACRQFFGSFGSRLAGESFIRIPDFIHGAVFAPAGAGKGTGFLIPNALAYDKSLVINDPQGSIFAASADHRGRRFGHNIVRLDPFNVCGKGTGALNVFDFLPPATAPDYLDACRDLANMLVVRSGSEENPYWDDRAENVLTFFICFVGACERDPARRNLVTVRRLISSREAYMATLNVVKTMPGMPAIVKQQGESMSWLADKELNSVLSVTSRHTSWMDSPAVAAFLSSSSFDPMDLKRGTIDVFNILPPEKLVTMAPLSRVVFGSIIRTITRGKASERNPVLFLIDEAAHLGRMQILEDAVTLMRGYGIRLFFAFQSVNQLTKVYGDNAQTIIDNLNTQMYFGVNSYEGGEHVSKLIGECTIETVSTNDGTSDSQPTTSPGTSPSPGSRGTSSGVTVSEQARRWAKPEEIRTAAADVGWLFHRNHPVIVSKLIKYFEAPEFQNGGTGKSRGIGRAGAVLTGLTVACCLLLSAAVAAGLPSPRPRAVAASAMGNATSTPRPAFRGGPPAARQPRSRYDRRLPSQSGFLIRIPDPPPRPPAPAGTAPAANRRTR